MAVTTPISIEQTVAPTRGWVQKQGAQGETYFCKIATGEISNTRPTELSFQERLRYKKLDQKFGARAKQEMDDEEYVVEAREYQAKLLRVQAAASRHCSNLDTLCESAAELALALDELTEEHGDESDAESDGDGEDARYCGAWECMLMVDELEGIKTTLFDNVMEPVSEQLDLHNRFEEKVTAHIDALVDTHYYHSKVNQLASAKKQDVFKQDRNKLKMLEMEYEVALAKHELEHEAACLRHRNAVLPALCMLNNVNREVELLQPCVDQMNKLKEMYGSSQTIAVMEAELRSLPSKPPPPEKPAVSNMKGWLHGVENANISRPSESEEGDIDEEDGTQSDDEPEPEPQPVNTRRTSFLSSWKVQPKPTTAQHIEVTHEVTLKRKVGEPLGMKLTDDFTVESLVKGKAAANSKSIKKGDRIVSVNGRQIVGGDTQGSVFGNAGLKVKLELVRSGSLRDFI